MNFNCAYPYGQGPNFVPNPQMWPSTMYGTQTPAPANQEYLNHGRSISSTSANQSPEHQQRPEPPEGFQQAFGDFKRELAEQLSEISRKIEIVSKIQQQIDTQVLTLESLRATVAGSQRMQ